MLLFVACLATTGLQDTHPTSWEISNLGIFRRLSSNYVAIGPDGQCFILDSKERLIHHYGPNGDKIKTVGGKGSGPGEFENRPFDIYFVGDLFYVGSYKKIHIFDSNGNFLKWVETKSRNERLRKVANGWMVRDRGNHGPDNPTVGGRLFWRDQAMSNEKLLSQWTEDSKFIAAGKPLYFNPAPDRVLTAYSSDGNRVFIRPQNQANLLIFDVPTARIVRTVALEVPKRPFLEEQGEKIFSDFANQPLIKRSKVHVKKKFPKFYPAVFQLSWLGENLLGVYQKTGKPHPQIQLFFDRDGNSANPQFPPPLARYIGAIRGEWAYVFTFDHEEEEAGLVRRPLKGLKPYLESLRERALKAQK